MLAKSECVRCIRGRKFCGGNKEGVNGGNKYGGGGVLPEKTKQKQVRCKDAVRWKGAIDGKGG